jgi:hypothetical protein
METCYGTTNQYNHYGYDRLAKMAPLTQTRYKCIEPDKVFYNPYKAVDDAYCGYSKTCTLPPWKSDVNINLNAFRTNPVYY